ncbi:MAG: hypothetical protein WBB67_03235 [bacterium]
MPGFKKRPKSPTTGEVLIMSAEEAQVTSDQIGKLIHEHKMRFFKRGQLFREIKSKKLYKMLGYRTFDLFIKSLSYRIKRSNAYNYIKAYGLYEKIEKIDPDLASDLKYSKLIKLASQLESEKDPERIRQLAERARYSPKRAGSSPKKHIFKGLCTCKKFDGENLTIMVSDRDIGSRESAYKIFGDRRLKLTLSNEAIKMIGDKITLRKAYSRHGNIYLRFTSENILKGKKVDKPRKKYGTGYSMNEHEFDKVSYDTWHEDEIVKDKITSVLDCVKQIEDNRIQYIVEQILNKKTYKEIASELGISPTRVYQLSNIGIKEIRTLVREKFNSESFGIN